MTEKEMINRIKELKKIQPDSQWLAFSRLEMQKKMAGSLAENKSLISSQNFTSLLRFFGQPAMAILSVMVFLAGAGLVTAKEAQNSLPGDRLYPLKIALEKVEVKITTNEMAKAKLEAEMAGRRAQELTKISSLPTFPKYEKSQKVQQAMDQIDQQIAATEGLKEKMQNTQNKNSKEIADAAKTIKENNEKLQAAIEEAQKQIPEIPENKALAAKISDISDKLDKTHAEISEIIDSIEEAKGDVNKVQVENNATEAPKAIPKD